VRYQIFLHYLYITLRLPTRSLQQCPLAARCSYLLLLLLLLLSIYSQTSCVDSYFREIGRPSVRQRDAYMTTPSKQACSEG